MFRATSQIYALKVKIPLGKKRLSRNFDDFLAWRQYIKESEGKFEYTSAENFTSTLIVGDLSLLRDNLAYYFPEDNDKTARSELVDYGVIW